jgi:Aspartyl protease
MRFTGRWELLGSRHYPLVVANVQGIDGRWHADLFLIDTGADRTVFTWEFYQQLGLVPNAAPPTIPITGVGGSGMTYLLCHGWIGFPAASAPRFAIYEEFAVATNPDALELNLLGRDILDHFDLIVSRRRGEVLLLTDTSSYTAHS